MRMPSRPSPRNPVKDQVAIIGTGSTGYTRHGSDRTQAALAVEACMNAVQDAGVDKSLIDGVVGTIPPAPYVTAALGLTDIRYHTSEMTPFGHTVIQAANAIFAGACDMAVVYHSVYRTPMTSRSAAADPFRRRSLTPAAGRDAPDRIEGATAYAAWASRYMHETGTTREHLGQVAVSDRGYGCLNPLAAMQSPLSLDDYLSARMVREPLCLFDMDVPADGADALVMTTAERARDLSPAPVLLHATATGVTGPGGFLGGEIQTRDLHHHGQQIVARDLRAKSDLWLDDIDVYFPYDGFTFITLAWIENIGWCDFGEAGEFLQANLDKEGRIRLHGRVPVNPHGGAISEGATQGAGHIREAVTQLRGKAGRRQVPSAQTALVTPGGFFFNSQGLVLRRL
jgi:acetyl-CoA acetyltransferase